MPRCDSLLLMRYYFLLLGVILSLNVSADVEFKFKTDSPEYTQTLDLGPSDLIDDKSRHVKLKCEVFPAFVLLTMSDPGMKGVGYQVLSRKTGLSGKKTCENISKPQDFSFWGSLEGVTGSTIAYRRSEPLGSLDHLTFYDAKKKKSVLSVAFNTDAPLQIEKTGKVIGVNYEAFLNYPVTRCNPVVDNQGACLKSILSGNNIPESVTFERLDCAQAIRENAKDANAGSVHLFLKTHIEDIEDPIKKVISKKITCTLSP